MADLRAQLAAARQALDKAEVKQLSGEAKELQVARPSQPGADNLAALRDKRRRLALQFKAVKEKVIQM